MIDLIPGISSTTTALSAERTRLDVIGENIANANVTRGEDGKPYQRKTVVFETALQQAVNGGPSMTSLQGIKIEKDQRPFPKIHKPGDPDADANGDVSMPNVNIHEEMADLIAATRAFEANLAVARNAKTLAMQTLAIGKR